MIKLVGIDLDGTLLKHNGYKIDGQDTFLDGAKKFLDSISDEDMIIFLTSRKDNCKDETEAFLRNNNIRFNHIIYGAPYGERLLVNDDKPSGLCMCYGIRKTRDSSDFVKFNINENL